MYNQMVGYMKQRLSNGKKTKFWDSPFFAKIVVNSYVIYRLSLLFHYVTRSLPYHPANHIHQEGKEEVSK